MQDAPRARRPVPTLAVAVAAVVVAGCAALAATPARAQIPVVGYEGRFAPGRYGGPCEQKDTHAGRMWGTDETRVVSYKTTIYLRGGQKWGVVAPPNCVPVELEPGEYVKRVAGYAWSKRRECTGAYCKSTRMVVNYDTTFQTDTGLTIDDKCEAPRQGRLAYLRGVARDASGRLLKKGDVIEVGQTVITAKGSRLSVLFPDGSQALVGANSRFANVYTSCEYEPPLTFDLVMGTIWSKVMHAIGAEPTFEVHTGNAVAGVRGTVFGVTVDDVDGRTVTTVQVVEGTVMVRHPAGTDSVAVRAGQQLRVVGDDPLGRPAPLPDSFQPPDFDTPVGGG